MSSNPASQIPWPGPGRLTLVALAVIPAALAYPWQSTRDYWLLGIAVVAVVLLLGWWRGLHFTTILRRRIATLGRRRLVPEPDSGTRTTALLRIGSPADGGDVLPLQLVAQYLDRYGIHADAVRITNRDSAGDRETWIGLTVSAAENLAALQARSSRIPLHETAEVAARRLADHLREIGWEASAADPEDVPRLFDSSAARETWSGVQQGSSEYVAAYRVTVSDSLAQTLADIRSQSASETWVAVEIARPGKSAGRYTVAAAAALRTDAPPSVPVAGLTPQRGNHGAALIALDPLSAQLLDGHTDAPADLLSGLDWPTPAVGAHRAPRTEPVRT